MVNAALPWKKCKWERTHLQLLTFKSQAMHWKCFWYFKCKLQGLSKASKGNVQRYSLACLALHNYLQPTDNFHYTPSIFVDSEDKNGNLVPREWMLLKGNYSNNNGLVSLPHVRGSRSWQDALEARCELKTFLYSDEGSLSSQTEYVWPTSLCFVVSTLFLITFNNKEKTQ